MNYRPWIVASCIFGVTVGLVFWQLLGSSPTTPTPVLTPLAVSRAPEADIPPITNPFGTANALPRELTAEMFSKMTGEFSEPNGYFMYENYVSNERSYQDPIPALTKVARPGGVYLGVGPEQNFT